MFSLFYLFNFPLLPLPTSPLQVLSLVFIQALGCDQAEKDLFFIRHFFKFLCFIAFSRTCLFINLFFKLHLLPVFFSPNNMEQLQRCSDLILNISFSTQPLRIPVLFWVIKCLLHVCRLFFAGITQFC